MSTTIGIKAAGFSNITRSLRSAGRVLEDANGIASSVKKALDMEVKSRGSIESNIAKFIRKSGDSEVRIGILKVHTENALSDFFDKDKLNARRAPGVPKTVNNMAKKLFSITAAAVMTSVSAIASGIMGGIKIGKAIFSKVTELFTGGKKKKGKQNNKSAYAFTDDEGVVTVYNNKEEYDARVAKDKAEKAAIEAARIAAERKRLYGDANPDVLVEIDANQYAGKIEDGLDLNEYIILPGMKPEYCVKQTTLTNCTAFATITVSSVYAGYKMTDVDKLWVNGLGLKQDINKDNPLTTDGGTVNYSDEIKLINIVDNINKGVPIGIKAQNESPVYYTNSKGQLVTDDTSHMVACVGVKKGIDVEAFKREIASVQAGSQEYWDKIYGFADNILVSDSNGAKMRTLADVMKKKSKDNGTYGTLKGKALWYPDDAAGVYSFNGNPS